MSRRSPKKNIIISKVENPLIKNTKIIFSRKNANNLDSNIIKKINELTLIEFSEKFNEMLITSKDIFINKIIKEIEYILKKSFPKLKNNYKDLIEIANQNLEENYNQNYLILNNEWKKYKKQPKTFNYLTHYRKHCIKTEEYAYHSCNNKKSKLIEIYNNEKEVSHLICIECKRCFLSNEILLYCNNCSLEYYSCTIPKNEEINLFPSTWEKYHCGGIINNIMKCIKCQNILYLNLKDNYLTCLNAKCKFKAKPESIIWNCAICKSEFKSNAKIYNPLEMEIIKRAVKKTLLYKENAYPNEIPCCKVNVKELIFFHKEECKGELYLGTISNKKIIVCSKCNAMNFYDKFIWTCPLCLKKFRNYKSPFNSIFKKTEYIIIDNTSSSISPRKKDRYTECFRDSSPMSLGKSVGFNSIKSYLNQNFQEKTKKYNLNIQRINNSSDENSIVNLVTEVIPKKKGSKYLYDILQKRNHSNSKGKENDNNSKNIINLSSDRKNNNEYENNNVSTNDNSSLGNISNQPSKKIKKITINLNEPFERSKSNKSDKNKEEREFSLSNDKSLKRITIKAKTQTKRNTKKDEELEKEEELDTINDLDEDNIYGLKKKPSIKWNNVNNKKFDKLDSLYDQNNNNKHQRVESEISLGDLSSNSEISMNLGINILTNPQKLKLIVNEGSIPEFEIEDYDYIKPIGEGSYGKIYLIQNKYDESKYALKKIICHDLNEVKVIHNKLELIYSNKHPNIMKIIGVQYKCLDITTYSLYILMELALSDWNNEIKKRIKEKKYYTEKEIINIITQILSSLMFLENKGIAHRDIKPQNILIFENNIYKVTDFGEAKSLSHCSQEATLRGSQLYMSPILYNGLKFNQKDVIHNAYKSDVFSLGFCLVFSLSLNLNLLSELREIISMKTIASLIRKNIKRYYSPKMINLVIKMIEFEESERFSFLDIKNYIEENFNFDE